MVTELRVVLTVKDLDAALAFFRDALGLEQLAEFNNNGGRGFLLDGGRATLEIFDERQAEAIDEIEVGQRSAGPVRLAFQTEDSAELASRVKAAGGKIIGGPVLTPWGDRNARVVGPESIQLTLFSAAQG
jgi:methylmalonyl-CoA/ethylmalonyl-CoA epimerase